ncbi:GTP-binding protein YPTM2 [Pelomyxa schiedti]|nr:GTP-binding protein YPTM2 [Pelomyxa schiedti]
MALVRDFDCVINVRLLGDYGVGKSCLLLRFVEDQFLSTHIATIGVDFQVRTVLVESKIIRIHIWDLLNTERTRNFYQRCDGLIVLYDITDISSFHGVSSWLGEVGRYFTTTPQIILVGTKLAWPPQTGKSNSATPNSLLTKKGSSCGRHHPRMEQMWRRPSCHSSLPSRGPRTLMRNQPAQQPNKVC